MKILILGGTRFLGRQIAAMAIERGDQVTLFNRDRTNADLFLGQAELLRGDRDSGLDVLKAGNWDICIDPSGYVPRLVGDCVRLLADHVGHYTFVSSISVYAKFLADMDESGELAKLNAKDADTETVNSDTYGPLKALCEAVAEELMPGRVLNVRAGLIVGEFDPTNRLSYWPARIKTGGEFIVPAVPEMPMQYIDVKDLSAWILAQAGNGTAGAFNVTGPGKPQTFAEFIGSCLASIESDGWGAPAGRRPPVPVWVDEQFLLDRDIQPWTGLPLWLPPGGHNMGRTSIKRALATGLQFRPLKDTIADILTWYGTLPSDQAWPAGVSQTREKTVLDEWNAR